MYTLLLTAGLQSLHSRPSEQIQAQASGDFSRKVLLPLYLTLKSLSGKISGMKPGSERHCSPGV